MPNNSVDATAGTMMPTRNVAGTTTRLSAPLRLSNTLTNPITMTPPSLLPNNPAIARNIPIPTLVASGGSRNLSIAPARGNLSLASVTNIYRPAPVLLINSMQHDGNIRIESGPPAVRASELLRNKSKEQTLSREKPSLTKKSGVRYVESRGNRKRETQLATTSTERGNLSDEKSLDHMVRFLSQNAPHVKNSVLSKIALSLCSDLSGFIDRKITAAQPLSNIEEINFKNILHNFLSVYDEERLGEIIDSIITSEIPPAEKKNRVGHLKAQAKSCQRAAKSYAFHEQVRLKKRDGIDPLKTFINVLNDDLVNILVSSGLTPQQFIEFVEMTDVAKLIQDLALLGVGLDELDDQLQDIVNDPELPDNFRRINEHSVQQQIRLMKDMFDKILLQISPYDDQIDFDALRLRSDREEEDDYNVDYYNYTDDLAELINRSNLDPDEVIAHRVKRLFEIRFLDRLPGDILFEQVLQHSPLFMARSVINAEQRELYYDGVLCQKSIKQHLTSERYARMKSFLRDMVIAPLVIGEGFPVTQMNLAGLPYGDKGFSIEYLCREFIDNLAISHERLAIIGLYCNSHEQFTAITKKGKVDIDWMSGFNDDSLEKLFQALPDPEQSNEPDNFLLLYSLRRIGQQILGSEFNDKQIARLIEDAQPAFTKRLLNTDQLAYLLFSHPYGSEGLRGIVTIAAEMSAERGEGEEPYRPQGDWYRLVATLAGGETYREKLNVRQQTLQTQIDAIPADALYSDLAHSQGITIFQENEDGDFIARYDPDGGISHEPPSQRLNQPFLALRPDTLLVFDRWGRTNTGFQRVRNTNFSALQAVIEMQGADFRAAHGVSPTDAERHDNVEKLATDIIARFKSRPADSLPKQV